MNYALILAAGVGQRMRNGGLPKQFLKLMGKPIVIYTLERFEECEKIDQIIVVCHGSYIDLMKKFIDQYQLQKVSQIIVGGSDRQISLQRGLEAIADLGGAEEDLVVIHDGVRPLVREVTITENLRVAEKYGCAITVEAVTESVVITEEEEVTMPDFKKRADTYTMTSPQTFKLGEIRKAYGKTDSCEKSTIPLLDAAMVYANAGGTVRMVKEQGPNIKITTPEDYYYLKAMLELEENKFVFGL